MSFSFLKFVQDRGLGRPHALGWKEGLYSSFFARMGPTKVTESSPCDGLEWGAVFGFGFSPDGSMLGAACENKCMLLYDPNNGKLIQRRMKTHSDCVNCVRFLDNRMFATCSDDSTVRLWDARFLSHETRILKGHTSWVKNIEYSSSEGKLITSGFDGNIFAWDINNYSEVEKAEPLFYINGMMRTKITPDESKMIVSTLGGYFLLIHDLDLNHLKEDLLGFKPHLYRLMQLMNTPLHHALQYNYMFTRKRNRVEFMCDFPDADNAESISTMQVHPEGWCIASRNTTLDEESEWTCIHDIQPLENGSKMGILRESASSVSTYEGRSGEAQRSTQSIQVNRSSHSTHTDSLPPSNFLDYPSVFWDLYGIRSHLSGFGGWSARDGGDNEDNDGGDNEDNENSADELEDTGMFSDDEVVDDETLPGQSQQNRNLSLSVDTSSEELSDSSSVSSNSSPQRTSDSALLGSASSVPWSDTTSSVTVTSSSSSSSAPQYSTTNRLGSSVDGELNDSRVPRGQASHSNVYQHMGRNDDRNDDSAPSGLVFYEAMTISRGGRVRRRMAIRNTNEGEGQPLSIRTGHMRIRNVKPRLLYYSEEPNIGRGFIKEQSFSPCGRVLASPFGNCVRLLAFSDRCSELCDMVPKKPRPLKSVAMTVTQKSNILASTFSPTHCMFVAGGRDGSISFSSPKL